MLQLLALLGFVVIFIFKVFGYLLLSALGLLITTGGIVPFILFFLFFGFIEVIKVNSKQRPRCDNKEEAKRKAEELARFYKAQQDKRQNKDKNLYDPNYKENKDK